MKPASKVAVCGLSSALSVLILFLGGVVSVFAYVCPMITGVIMIMLVTTFGYPCAWITYVSTSILSFFLVPDKECMLMYVMFFGYYTIVRIFVGRIKPKAVSFLLKLIIFNVALVVENVILFYVFGIPFMSSDMGKTMVIVFWIAMNLLFLFYEKLLTSLDIIYRLKIEKRIKHVLK